MEGISFFDGRVHRRWCMPNQNALKRNILVGLNKGAGHGAANFCCSSQSGRLSREIKPLNSSENQLRSLDSYFRKLQHDAMQPSSSKSSRRPELILDGSDPFTTKKGLTSLEDYLGKLKKDANSNMHVSSSPEGESYVAARSYHVKRGYNSLEARKLKPRAQLKDEEEWRVAEKISDDETSNLYLIGILAAINIAVFLFEIASPVRSSELHLFSLPMLYGVKINQLILVGEWWRLLTPMFLHTGVFHIGLSCWMLVSFGPQVCRWYGPFSFFLIYVLGGLSGNLISFLHTPDPTVCGTGPAFAIMGTLIAYQIQNRGVLGINTEKMIQKAFIATCLSCTLSNLGPVDDWTHLGAAFTGLAYGFFTCPTVQVDEKTSERVQEEEGIRLVTRYAGSCKSLAYFCFFILLWCSLLFVIEPPL